MMLEYDGGKSYFRILQLSVYNSLPLPDLLEDIFRQFVKPHAKYVQETERRDFFLDMAK